MNKNTVVAFIIIIGSVMFFTSPTYNKFYTEKIMKKEYKENRKNQENYYLSEEKIENRIEEQNKENSNNKPIEYNDTTTLAGDTIWIENEKMKIGISEIGAIIVSIIMKDYKYNNKIIDIIENNKEGGAQLIIGNKHYDKLPFKFIGENREIKVYGKKEKIEFKFVDEENNEIKKIFEIYKNEYLIKMIVEKNTLPGERIGIGWYCGIEESEKKQQKNVYEKKVVHYYNGSNVQHLLMNKEGKEETTGRYQWVGITSKYFFIAVNNDSIIDTDIKIETKGKDIDKNFNYKIEMSRIAEKQKEIFTFYTGPTKREELKKYKQQYDKILFPVIGWGKIFFWSDKWFPILAEFVLLLMIEIQKIVKDYGIAILILTVITKIVTYPLTISSMKSMERMKDIQPKVNQIRQKHKNNPQKMNEEIMAMYKKEGVNPLNPGCLPIFLQMPIFIALFVVLRKAIELRGADTVIIPWVNDLSKPEVLFSLETILPNGIPMYGTNIALLPILMAILTFYQQKMTIKDPNQKALIYFMPIFMLVIFNSFPAGLVLYWTFQSALQLVQQIAMTTKVKIKK